MEEALRRVGITSINIQRGEIFKVRDELITLPKSRLPSQPPREIHEYRLVLVLQTDTDNQDVKYPLVLVAPLSHRVKLKDDKDYRLIKGKCGNSKDSLVQLGLIQPILKTELVTPPIGKLDSFSMMDVEAILAANLGLIERQSPGLQTKVIE